LAAGLLASLDVVEQERRRSPEVVPWLVLLSDGRANVGMSGGLGSADAITVARRVKAAGIHAIVVDASGPASESHSAREIAAAAGADFVRLGDARHTLVGSVRERVHGR